MVLSTLPKAPVFYNSSASTLHARIAEAMTEPNVDRREAPFRVVVTPDRAAVVVAGREGGIPPIGIDTCTTIRNPEYMTFGKHDECVHDGARIGQDTAAAIRRILHAHPFVSHPASPRAARHARQPGMEIGQTPALNPSETFIFPDENAIAFDVVPADTTT